MRGGGGRGGGGGGVCDVCARGVREAVCVFMAIKETPELAGCVPGSVLQRYQMYLHIADRNKVPDPFLSLSLTWDLC